jgi:hypothetical protein
LEIGADDAERQGGEGEGPVGVAIALDGGEDEGDEVCDCADGHEEFVGDFVLD